MHTAGRALTRALAKSTATPPTSAPPSPAPSRPGPLPRPLARTQRAAVALKQAPKPVVAKVTPERTDEEQREFDELVKAVKRIAKAKRENPKLLREVNEKVKLPAFCHVTWEGICEEFNIDPALGPTGGAFIKADMPEAQLPRRILEAMAELGGMSIDAYGDTNSHRGEEERVRTLEPYMLVLITLFFGRVRNLPDAPMLATTVSSVGEVEHEFVAFNGTWLCVFETKYLIEGKNQSKCIAQLLAELQSACAANLKKKSSQKRVFGVLSDLMSYCVFSFDGTTFLYHGALECRRGRKEYLEDMCAIANMLFGLILLSFRLALNCIRDASESKIAAGDITGSVTMNLPTLPPQTEADFAVRKRQSLPRPSLENWEEALHWTGKAEKCFAPDGDEAASESGVEMLELAMACLPRYPGAWDAGPDTLEGRAAEATRVVKAFFEERHGQKAP